MRVSGDGALVGRLSARVGRPVWTLTLYPEAGEAGGALVSPSERGERSDASADPLRSEAAAARRAREKVRRYWAANRLNRFGTLTYAGEGCHDPVELRGHVAGFFRQLRSGLGGERLPYAWAAEWHPGGHGLHVHFAVARFVSHHLIRDVWGRGRIHIKADRRPPGRLGRARGSAQGGQLPRQVRGQVV